MIEALELNKISRNKATEYITTVMIKAKEDAKKSMYQSTLDVLKKLLKDVQGYLTKGEADEILTDLDDKIKEILALSTQFYI